MKKSHLLFVFALLFVVFSCKKDKEETPAPVAPGDMSITVVKTNVSCFGGNDGSIDITVTGGTLPYSYIWSNGSTLEDQSGLTAGSYIVTVLDQANEIFRDTIQLTQAEEMIISEVFLPDVLDISVTGGTPPYTYLWSTGATTEDLANYNYTPCSVTVTDANDCSTFKEFSPDFQDGIFVMGAACSLYHPDENGMMHITRNEVNQVIRPSLFEIYIPLKAGTQGFNIRRVHGSQHTNFGPGSDWGIVSDPDPAEPKDVQIQRGSAEENSATFNIIEDGMYHVVIDMELMIAVVCQVHWGVIGGCIPTGWLESTTLTESAYDPVSMSWEITDLDLSTGDFKLRYSNGWKIELNPGGNLNDLVNVNTNFGGSIDALIPGGDNMVNTDAGQYTITMDYTIGTEFSASMVKTGDPPYTDWTGVVCDAVGMGISIDNPSAIPDPSSWGWGNKLIADNGGIPTVYTNVYIWTWTDIILEADEGFKVRTENGLAPPVGGTNFDSGYNDLDIGASSIFVYDAAGNFAVSSAGTYTITLVIDAADSDAKTVTIVKN